MAARRRLHGAAIGPGRVPVPCETIAVREEHGAGYDHGRRCLTKRKGGG
jgi:hypothetical protein